jgi:hypothetical protein
LRNLGGFLSFVLTTSKVVLHFIHQTNEPRTTMQANLIVKRQNIVLFHSLVKQYDFRYKLYINLWNSYYVYVEYTGENTKNWVDFWDAYNRLTTSITEKKTPKYKRLFRRYTSFLR